ncbi:MAG: C39 family peptidase [Novosphingobium sp.]|nr:C39 family peptidase [Novosphingobium sp.]
MTTQAEHRQPHGLLLILLAGLPLAGCVTAPSAPAPVWLGQTSEGGPVMRVPVKSWKELKFTDLIRQRTDFSCGAAVLATIFNEAFGHHTTEQQVLVNMLKVADPDVVREKGFSLLDMKRYAISIGMAAEGYRIGYEPLQQLNLPVITLLNIKGYKHFVIVRKAYADQVAIGDPALGNRLMRRRDFEAAWNNIAFVVTGANYDPANVLLQPPDPLSARRLLELHAVLPAAETAEFGFGPGYSFGF